MKLAWFTPFTAASAIGTVGRAVAGAIQRDYECEVDIWTHQTDDLHSTDLRIRHFDSDRISPSELADYDYLVYNLGNNLHNHGPIYEVSQRYPGIVVLHDHCMHHFFAGYYFCHKKDTAAYLRAIESLYGPSAGQKAAQGLAKGHPLHEGDEVADYLFWEPCIANALAVVVHSQFAAELVRAKSPLPIACPTLPHRNYDELERIIPTLDRGRTAEDGKVHLLTLGHVNPNKRVHVVLDVLGKNPDLRKQIVYHVIGPLGDKRYATTLNDEVVKYGLESCVEFLNYQPDDVLQQHLCKADICINLRHPVFETGSASLIEAMYFGLPTIVTDTGAYRDTPESAALRIPVDGEAEHLERAVRSLVTDASLRRRVSHNAREHAWRNCTPESYAKKLFDLLQVLPEDAQVGRHFFGRLKQELREMGYGRGSVAIGQIATEVARFGAGLLDLSQGRPHPPCKPASMLRKTKRAARTFCFVHIPKTGGISVAGVLDRYFRPNEICPVVYIEDLVRLPRELLPRYRLFKGHFCNYLGEFLSGDVDYLTFLRNPIDRVVSWCQFTRGDPGLGYEEVHRRCPTLVEFVRDPEIGPLLRDVQTLSLIADSKLHSLDWIPKQGYLNRFEMLRVQRKLLSRLASVPDEVLLERAKKRLAECAFVGLTERMDDSMQLMCHTFGWPQPAGIPRYNVSRARIPAHELTEDAVAAIRQVTALDHAIYAEAQRIFEERRQRMIESQRMSTAEVCAA
jgi:glycosyltransferase involved in cell wall biosynthesis